MKRLNASVLTVAVVLALIAFVAPSSAYLISDGKVVCVSDVTTWTFTVTCDKDDPHAISNSMAAWCNEGAVKEVWVGSELLTRDGNPNGWDYVTKYDITGIKIDYEVEKGTTITVKIILDGCYETSAGVEWVIKAGQIKTRGLVLYGPVACTDPIPEFSTIAIQSPRYLDCCSSSTIASAEKSNGEAGSFFLFYCASLKLKELSSISGRLLYAVVEAN